LFKNLGNRESLSTCFTMHDSIAMSSSFIFAVGHAEVNMLNFYILSLFSPLFYFGGICV